MKPAKASQKTVEAPVDYDALVEKISGSCTFGQHRVAPLLSQQGAFRKGLSATGGTLGDME
ncbi:MAG: hypothetical protein LBM04_14045 [Opitutaceae bacterium]|jgi:hypothetical protein|nr:hypothetical protein [Opitutaceae bacterium]